MTAKYKAKYVYWDLVKRVVLSPIDIEIYRCNDKLKLPERIVRFDSQHEFKVYLELCRMYASDLIKLQVPVEILPPCNCYPKGKRWRLDFAIINSKNRGVIDFYVEAKGMVHPEFPDNLAMLEINNPYEFEKLYIVFPQRIPNKTKVIKSLRDNGFDDAFMTLNQLKKREIIA